MRPVVCSTAALTALVLLAGCTGDPEPAAGASGESPAGQPAALQPATTEPAARQTLVADADPVAAAVSTSRALFQSSPVVVLAPAGDPAAQLLGASAAVGLGVPLLLDGGAGTAATLDPELARLGTATVLGIGGAAAEGVDLRAVPADAAAVGTVTGLALAPADPVAADGQVAAVAALDPASPAALEPAAGEPAGGAAATSSSAPSSASSAPGAALPEPLPEVTRPPALGGTVVVASGSPDGLAAVATARAAGADVQVIGGTDPRASGELVDRLAADPAVVVLGADLAAEPGLDWKLATAAAGTQLPGGGQLLFPEHMLVALYGIPGSASLGLLGEQDLPGSIRRAQQLADEYRPLVDTTVVPTFEIIATVASSSAGADGDYSAEQDVETLRPWVEAAGAAGMYVVLDLQPGRSDFLSQAQLYQPLLELPFVGLALDPEWRLEPGGLPLQKIGQVGIDEVNTVVTWLADLTREKALPQKLLVLHQFQVRMVVDRERLDVSRDELAIMVHVDGQGGQSAKQDTWRVLHQGAQEELSWGWKNFIDEDLPMLTPGQTVEQVLPTPELVTYQ
ncbi:hypothetical protein [Modestobacter sp. SSW1-42]|uniref:hypothetical protein n=1 Tax=Modestobacter sp. SSW1-42 TaxID=596372 RepID=UPI003987D87B